MKKNLLLASLIVLILGAIFTYSEVWRKRYVKTITKEINLPANTKIHKLVIVANPRTLTTCTSSMILLNADFDLEGASSVKFICNVKAEAIQ